MITALSPKKLAQVKKHDFTKELKDFEYETKFDIQDNKLGSLEVLKKIRRCFDGNKRFILCEIKGGDKLLTRVSFSETIQSTRFSGIAAREWLR